MTTDKNNAAPDPQPAELAEQQGVMLGAVVEAICYDEHGVQIANVSPVVRERIRRALAATGNQQVGEVQELDFYREHIGNDLDNLLIGAGAMQITHEGGYEACWKNTMEAVERLAARQPGAQEPFGWIVTGPNGSTFLPLAARETMETFAKYMPVVEVYAAPPAQGIDLGQQQDAARWRWVREQNGVTVSVEEADDDGDMTFVSGHTPEELDAAIDSQRDAAPGVGNG